MSNRFPKMLYRFPAQLSDAASLQDGRYDTRVVDDEEAHDEALAAGWHEDPAAARQAHAATPVADAPPADNAPPTRAEMELKAHQLGLTFDRRLGDKKLLAMIEAALAPKA